jgi:polar amino acid transport system substrate-binding protein
VGGVLLFLACAAGPARSADGSLERVRQSGRLRVAIDPTYPPMEFEEHGKPVGFDIDFARAVARRLGVRAEFAVMDWAGIVAGLNSGRYDVIISSMNITADRQAQVDFVEYASMAQVFVCRRGTRIRTEQELANKVVAVQVNTTSHAWLDAVRMRGVAVREVKALPTPTDALTALHAGQADVVVVDESVGRYYAHTQPALVVTGTAADAEPVGIAVRKRDQALKASLAAAVQTMKDDGALRQISERWFGEELGQRPDTPLDFWHFSSGVALPRILQGMLLTLGLTAAGGTLGVGFGLGLALARVSRSRMLAASARAYVTLFRGTPLLLQLFFMFYGLPPLLGIRLGALTAGVLALALNMAAYVCEIVRAAIESVDKGQMEAARSLGMSHRQALGWVILPQAFRRMIPPLVNELAALSKDTSLVSVLALHEMLYETNRLAAAYLRPWEVYLWAGLGYLAIVLGLTVLANWLEKRLEVTGT